jgi:DNA-binding transcriptional LysR family regulator
MGMDWDDLKITFAIARNGSLNAAARALGLEGIVFSDALTLAEQLEAFDWPRARGF